MWIDNCRAAQPHEDSNIHFRIVHGGEGLNYDRRCRTKFVTRIIYACANRMTREEVGVVFKDEILKLFMILTKNKVKVKLSLCLTN
jgi:hypothetical protein